MKTKISIPKTSKIFLLEDSEERLDWFKSKLKGVDLVIAKDAKEAIYRLLRKNIIMDGIADKRYEKYYSMSTIDNLGENK